MLNPVDEAFLADLRAALPPACFRDPAPHYRGAARAFPGPRRGGGGAGIDRGGRHRDPAHANAARVPVVPYGGGTGLVGGQVSDGPAPVVLSLERMTARRGLDPLAGTLTVEAGAILSDVQAMAAEAGMLFPLSLASEGSARIGGLLATNAGGVNVIRYGNARDLCLGIEAVLPNGEVLHGLKGAAQGQHRL